MRKINPTVVSIIRTICEVHREMYDLLQEEKIDRKQLVDLLQEAYGLGKKMDAKLRQYKFNYNDGWFEDQKEEILKEKLERRGSKKSVKYLFKKRKKNEEKISKQ